MQISVSSTLTLYHDGQFWVGLVEHVEDCRTSYARLVFGAEPSNEEILEFVVRKWQRLRLIGSGAAEQPQPPKSPKRRLREAARELSRRAPSTKAQQALAEAREAQKDESRSNRSKARQEASQDRFEKKAKKRKEKRRGH